MTASQLMIQAERFMSQAEEVNDLDAWIKHYLIWINLVPLRIREGTLNRLANRFYEEERDEPYNQPASDDLPFFHPAVG